MNPAEVRARFTRFYAVAGLGFLVATQAGYAQRGGNDWMTSGYDAQRSHWVRNDPKISVLSLGKPGFELVWKLDLAERPRQLNSLTTPVLLDFYISYRGFRTLAFLTTSTDAVIGIDSDLARIEWQGKYGSGAAGASGTIECPGGISSATRPTIIAYPPAPTGRGFGRGSPAKSGVGEPHEGAVTLQLLAARRPPSPPPTPAAKPGSRGRATAPPSPFAPRIQWVNLLGADGKFHSLYVSNGEEPKSPIAFLPGGANTHGLTVFDNNAYVATTNGCGGADNGIWSLNVNSGQVNRWKAPSDIAGSAGPAVRPDGTLFVTTTGGELVALEEGTLKQKASYSTGGPKFTSSPVMFSFNERDLIAAASNDGRLHLADSENLATPLAKSPVYSSADYAIGALASWYDPSGTRWILSAAGGPAAGGSGFEQNGAVTNGAIVAWKVVDQNGKPSLQPGWVSRDMTSPLTPIIVNGVVFAVSSGEYRTSDPAMSAAERAKRSKPAVLYALDGETGKELWNSGDMITSFVHSGGLSAGGSRVYVAGHDGTQYAFGFPIEH